ncbi:MAG: hypothetical protein HXY25_06955 [Alphaproteobacteria bacterium]|nr:hypothetical protein [Alphaproteobacteria bacterium]
MAEIPSRVTGQTSSTGALGPVAVYGFATLSLKFAGAGTVVHQRSFDAGATWVDVATLTEASSADELQSNIFEAGSQVLHRLNVTDASAAIDYFLGV